MLLLNSRASPLSPLVAETDYADDCPAETIRSIPYTRSILRTPARPCVRSHSTLRTLAHVLPLRLNTPVHDGFQD